MDAFTTLYNLGLFDVIAPFITIFTFTYAIFRKTRIFGKYEKGYMAISLAFSIYFLYNLYTIQHTQELFAMFFYLLLVSLTFLVIIAFLFDGVNRNLGRVGIGWAGTITLIAILYTFSNDYNTLSNALSPTGGWIYDLTKKYLIDNGLYILLIILALLGAFIKWFTEEPKPKPKKSSKKDPKESIKNVLEGIYDLFIKK